MVLRTTTNRYHQTTTTKTQQEPEQQLRKRYHQGKNSSRSNGGRIKGYFSYIVLLSVVVTFLSVATFRQLSVVTHLLFNPGAAAAAVFGTRTLDDLSALLDAPQQYRISSLFLSSSSHQKQLVTASNAVDNDVPPTTTIAYVVSVTSCSRKFLYAGHLYDVASVLAKSIKMNSYPYHPTSRYGSDLIVITTPETNATKCIDHLIAAGFTPKVYDFPVSVDDIQQPEGAVLKDKIAGDGCCGEKELIKLHVYSMTDYPVAIHLDLDTLVLKPLDDVLDGMIYDPSHPSGRQARQRLLAPTSQDDKERLVRLATPTYKTNVAIDNLDIHAYYTKDYNMLPRRKDKIGIQGGVIIVKPNTTRRDELIEMVKSGEYYPGRDSTSGWFKKGYTIHIWGSMTIQGLLAYYFTELQHDTSIELNRCRFNQIGENPRRSSFAPVGVYPRGTPINVANATYHDNECRDGRDECNDVQCQKWPINETYILHYTYCKSPLSCRDILWNETWHDHQCKLMIKEWYNIRKLISIEKEQQQQQQLQQEPKGEYFPEVYNGFCNGEGQYIPLPLPS